MLGPSALLARTFASCLVCKFFRTNKFYEHFLQPLLIMAAPTQQHTGHSEQCSEQGEMFTWQDFNCEQNPVSSAATPPTCDQDCNTCRDQYLPELFTDIASRQPIRFHDDATAANTIIDLVDATKANYISLGTNIEKYGNVIAKRWMKRGKSERAKLILDVKPNMYKKKHAEVDVLYTIGADAQRSVGGLIEKYEDTNLMPYLDVESLVEGMLQLFTHGLPS